MSYRFLCLVVWLVFSSNPLAADVVVDESFAYPEGESLSGQDGGLGWAGAWSTGAAGTIESGFSYSDGALVLPTVGGSAFQFQQSAFRDIQVTGRPAIAGLVDDEDRIGATGSSVWFRVLAVCPQFGAAGDNGGFTLRARTGPSSAAARVFLGEGSTGADDVWQLKLTEQIGVTSDVLDFDTTTPGVQSAPLSQQALFVGRIDFEDATDVLTLWIDPLLSQEPQDGNANYVGSSLDLSFDVLTLQALNQMTAGYDEIRVATSFVDLVTSYRRGDCNQDSAYDIADAIQILGILFTGSSAPGCQDACDLNDDGLLNIADGIYALASLFSGGPDPAAPFTACGPDPTADLLNCASYLGACP